MSLPIITEEKKCDECYKLFIDAKYGEGICPSCRQMLALESIAELLAFYAERFG